MLCTLLVLPGVQANQCIPQTTLEDMHLWAYGFLGFAEEFFEMFPDTDAYIMPARFTQDSLENLFGRIRAVGSAATNPNQLSAARGLNTVLAMRDVQVAKGSYTKSRRSSKKDKK